MKHPTDEIKQAIKTYFSSLLEELHNHMEHSNKIEVLRSFLSLALSAYRLKRLVQLEIHPLAEHLTQMYRNDDGSLDINSLLKSWEENLRESASWNATEKSLSSHKTFQEFWRAIFEQDREPLFSLRRALYLIRLVDSYALCGAFAIFYYYDLESLIIINYEIRVLRKKKERYLQRLYIPPNANRLCLDSASSDAIATLFLVNNAVRKRSLCTHHRITTSLCRHHLIAKRQKCERLLSTQ